MVVCLVLQTQAVDHFPVEAFKILVKLRCVNNDNLYDSLDRHIRG